MKFQNPADLQLFLIEINKPDLLATVDLSKLDEFKITDELYEIFIGKRRPLRKRLKNLKRAQDTKSSWRGSRLKRMSGIKRYHRSTRGKAFHRALGRHLATREDLTFESRQIVEVLKALSSLKTHTYIEMDYFMTVTEQLEYEDFVKAVCECVLEIESQLLEDNFTLTEEQEDTLFALTETASVVQALATRAGKTVSEIESLWVKAKEIVKKDYTRSEDDPGFYALVVGIVKKMAGIQK